jgi:hypothetical protein
MTGQTRVIIRGHQTTLSARVQGVFTLSPTVLRVGWRETISDVLNLPTVFHQRLAGEHLGSKTLLNDQSLQIAEVARAAEEHEQPSAVRHVQARLAHKPSEHPVTGVCRQHLEQVARLKPAEGWIEQHDVKRTICRRVDRAEDVAEPVGDPVVTGVVPRRSHGLGVAVERQYVGSCTCRENAVGPAARSHVESGRPDTPRPGPPRRAGETYCRLAAPEATIGCKPQVFEGLTVSGGLRAERSPSSCHRRIRLTCFRRRPETYAVSGDRRRSLTGDKAGPHYSR